MLVEREGLSPDEERQRWEDFARGSELFEALLRDTLDFDQTAAHVINDPNAPALFKDLLTVGDAYKDGLDAALEVAGTINGVPAKISIPSIEFVGNTDEVRRTSEPESATYGFIVGIVGCEVYTNTLYTPTFFGIASIPTKEGEPMFLGVDIPFGSPLPTYVMKDHLNPSIQRETREETTAAVLAKRLRSENSNTVRIKHAAAS